MKIIVEEVFFQAEFAPPEKVLWLAVIERAILDMVDPPQEIDAKHKRGLRKFFFEIEPLPFNLTYICNNLFDYPDAAIVIRKRLQQLLEDNKSVVKRCRSSKGYY